MMTGTAFSYFIWALAAYDLLLTSVSLPGTRTFDFIYPHGTGQRQPSRYRARRCRAPDPPGECTRPRGRDDVEDLGDRVVVDGFGQAVGAEEQDVAVKQGELVDLGRDSLVRAADDVGNNVAPMVPWRPLREIVPPSIRTWTSVWSLVNCSSSPSRNR